MNSNYSPMQAILNFIKYNNGFPLILVVLFLGAGVTLAANQGAKQNVVLSEGAVVPETTPNPIDTTKLLGTNFATYDANLKVTAVTQDSNNYFVKYTYQTLAIVDTTWTPVSKTGTLTVPKKLLGTRDLGLYVAEQLGQVVDQQVAYLKEVQSAEKAKSSPEKQAAGGKYASLAGSKLDAKGKTFDGYTPVVTPDTKNAKTSDKQKSTPDITTIQTDTQTAQTLLSKKEVQDMIVAAVAEFLAVDTSMPDTTPVPVEKVVPPPETIPVPEMPTEEPTVKRGEEVPGS